VHACRIYDKVSEYHSSAIHKARTAFSHQRQHVTRAVGLKQSVEKVKGLSKEERQAMKESRRQERQETLQKRLLKTRAAAAAASSGRSEQSPTETLLAKIMGIVPIGNFSIKGQALKVKSLNSSSRLNTKAH
jgi:hypothetical protein